MATSNINGVVLTGNLTRDPVIEVACTLWGREDIADARLSPVLYSTDHAKFERVIKAMRIRRGLAA
jgi:hypothetical protein